MRALAIILISVVLLECFYTAECQRPRPVFRYKPNPPCRQPFNKDQSHCRPPCPNCKGTYWTPYVCSR
uniref:Putative 5.3 kDa protein n=1 Tax=Ixodes ricinus TaxID=34613 RepID=A0A6B0TWD0_IXORI